MRLRPAEQRISWGVAITAIGSRAPAAEHCRVPVEKEGIAHSFSGFCSSGMDYVEVVIYYAV